jgi:hypothetical protein
MDYAIEDCLRADQHRREDPRKWQVPEVLFRLIPHPTKLTLENPTRSSKEEAEYQISNSEVCVEVLEDSLNCHPM